MTETPPDNIDANIKKYKKSNELYDAIYEDFRFQLTIEICIIIFSYIHILYCWEFYNNFEII